MKKSLHKLVGPPAERPRTKQTSVIRQTTIVERKQTMAAYRSSLYILFVAIILSVSMADSEIMFTLPKDLEIVCSDSLDNVCTAPVAW